MTLETEILAALKSTRAAAGPLALCPTEGKNRMLAELARSLRKSRAEIIAANRSDLDRARAGGMSDAMLDRLTLTDDRIEAMAHGVEEVAGLPDPVGEVIARWERPNGLQISQVRVPFGVIAIIYESRPNVTVDAGALLIKSGNAVVLRGGKEALSTNGVLAAMIKRALERTGLPPDAVMFVNNPDRDVIRVLKSHPEAVDLIIPRGGKSLKQALADSAVPLMPHFDGICHTYVDRAADLAMAEEICFNAKCSRPSVCNAMENLLVHAAIAEQFLPRLAARLERAGVELRGCPRTCAIVPGAKPASDADWDAEYHDLILAIKVVDSLDEALAFIAQHGSKLSDAIVTGDREAAARFEREVDSACVYVNASTRFTDGFEFGFGAETGISTNRLHARGPMGLRELTTYKYLVHGTGQIRK
ncbi:MAG: glutamate-5-semialdehyde dehydrogenase [Candidatus Binatales bacterium]